MAIKPKPQEKKPTAKPKPASKSTKATASVINSLPPIAHKTTAEAMTTDALTSPLRLLKTAVSEVLECACLFKADFGNEDHNGNFVVALCTEEIVGCITASLVVVAPPNTPEADLDDHFATVEGNKIAIVGPAQPSPWLQHSNQWIKFLDNNGTALHTAKLATTMLALVTKMKEKKRTKKTVIDFASEEISLTNDHFNEGTDGDNELVILPIPHSCKVTDGAGSEAEVAETICTWRAFIDSSQQALTAANGNNKKKTAKERMMKLKNGAIS